MRLSDALFNPSHKLIIESDTRLKCLLNLMNSSKLSISNNSSNKEKQPWQTKNLKKSQRKNLHTKLNSLQLTMLEVKEWF
jgi:hypothetical protein